jgi:hypothetical protein
MSTTLASIQEKETRLNQQLTDIHDKEQISLTRSRMLEIAQERNIFARKLFYSLVALILFILILTIVIYMYRGSS